MAGGVGGAEAELAFVVVAPAAHRAVGDEGTREVGADGDLRHALAGGGAAQLVGARHHHLAAGAA